MKKCKRGREYQKSIGRKNMALTKEAPWKIGIVNFYQMKTTKEITEENYPHQTRKAS